MKQICLVVTILMLAVSQVFAGAVAGKVADKQTGDALVGANVYVQGTSMGASTDEDGMFYFDIDAGTYTIVCTFVGYVQQTKQVTVDDGTVQMDFSLQSSVLRTSEIIVEASRARDRETPVAFTDINAEEIARKFTVQDIPHMFANTPGIFVTTDGGSGMGDSKVYVRGFDEQRISVMINNIEVNDPESKKVYWSNWGSLPSGSQSIQVQRGAGSTLYGAGAFGGSINVLTADAPAVSSLKVNATAGMYNTYKFGIDYNTGLFANDKMSFLTRINYMDGNGWRNNTYYQGISYYFGLSYFPNEEHTLRVVLHGAPQQHAYSYYQFNVKDFATYGRDWNGHPYVNESDPNLTAREKDGTSLADILLMSHIDVKKGGEIIGNSNVSFDNNVYHKPQFEVHHTWDMSEKSYLQTTAFFSLGRGYGENMNAYYKVARDDAGRMNMAGIQAAAQSNRDLYQYRNYSIHNQAGLVTTYNTKWQNHDISFGAEGRYWWARHNGEILNTFGKDEIRYFVGNVAQYFKQNQTYYDYTTIKPNVSIFAHGLWNFDDLSIMTDLQFASRMYNINEDFPSSNNYAVADGEEYNFERGGAKYKLWKDYNKTYNFVSPKFGINYNISSRLNVFANYSKVYNEPRVKYFFFQGSPRDLPTEISDDFELGLGFADQGFNFKLNLYRIDFSNKALRIADFRLANTPGYDYKGRRYVTVGTANYQGIEFTANMDLARNLNLGTSVSAMENAWGDDISEEAKTELGIQEGNIEPGVPQFMFAGVLNYKNGPFYLSGSAKFHKDYYILPSNDYEDLSYDVVTQQVTDRGKVLPSWTVVDLIIGWQQKMGGLNLNAALHFNNLLDANYWQNASDAGYGLLPGAERNVIFNLAVGL